MSELDKDTDFTEFIRQIPLTRIISYFDDLKRTGYYVYEKYPEFENIQPEVIVGILSVIYKDEELIDVKKKLPFLRNLYLTMLEVDNFPMNKDSILLETYVPDEEYLVSCKKNTNETDVKKFMEKYSFDEKFSSEIDFKIAKIYYEKLEFMIFIVYTKGEEVDSYERKHYFIKKFYEIWDIYKTEINKKDKDRFFENIIKKEFSNLNWTTMSRLYDPYDKEFLNRFSQNINSQFAKQYNPNFKIKNY